MRFFSEWQLEFGDWIGLANLESAGVNGVLGLIGGEACEGIEGCGGLDGNGDGVVVCGFNCFNFLNGVG